MEYSVTMVTLKKWTVQDLLALEKAGRLEPDERIELLDGEVYKMQPIGEGHAGETDWVSQLFQRHFMDKAIVRVQNPVFLDDGDLPQPDLALLKFDPTFYRKQHPKPEDIYLVVEISDSTLTYDRGRKLKRYALAGVREVWIINLTAKHTEVFRDPAGDEYLTRFAVKVSEAVAPLAFPEDALVVITKD
jgi:Uma2 family endonuclease